MLNDPTSQKFVIGVGGSGEWQTNKHDLYMVRAWKLDSMGEN